MGLIVNPYALAADADTDPDFASVILLVHAEGGVLTEVVGASTGAVIGAGALSSVQAKFGSESFLNGGSTSEGTNFVRYTAAASSLFVLPGLFTVEGWYYSGNAPAQAEHLWSTVDGIISGAGDWGVQRTSNDIALFRFNGVGYATLQSSGNQVTDNAWSHFAITRDGANRVDIWINGVSRANGTITGDFGRLISSDSLMCIGRGNNSDNMDWRGYWEEVRGTKGVCRYTTTFTPSVAPFPDS